MKALVKEIAAEIYVIIKWSGAVLAALGALYIAAQVYVYGLNRIWYAMEYGAELRNVFIDPQPHDCEFWKAPVGNKYCHYEKMAIGDRRNVTVSWIKKSD